MTELIAPTTELHESWLAARADWGPGEHEDGFGLHPSDETGTPAGFAAWVGRLRAAERPEPDGRVHATFRWIVEDGRVQGGIALRRGDDEYIRVLGHLGYGIRPSARRRGLGSWALGRMLDVARAAGLTRVLLVCEDGNTASARTIEHNGGVLERVAEIEHGRVRRYWIDLTR